jgi:hypothetical protein
MTFYTAKMKYGIIIIVIIINTIIIGYRIYFLLSPISLHFLPIRQDAGLNRNIPLLIFIVY